MESFNTGIKRKVNAKAEFPMEESLDAFIKTLVTESNVRHFSQAYKVFKQVEDTLESYFD